MHRLVLLWAVGIAALMASCDDDAALVDTDSETCRAHGSITDLGREPRYSADYLHRWSTTDGCAVRLDVLMTRRGEGSCGGDRVADLLMGTPLGSSSEHSDPRQFIRDPDGVLVDRQTSDAFDPHARVPADAEDTGFRQDEVELWMRPGKDSFVYLVDGDRVEAWPRDVGSVAVCA